jgi:hypothetical protein
MSLTTTEICVFDAAGNRVKAIRVIIPIDCNGVAGAPTSYIDGQTITTTLPVLPAGQTYGSCTAVPKPDICQLTKDATTGPATAPVATDKSLVVDAAGACQVRRPATACELVQAYLQPAAATPLVSTDKLMAVTTAGACVARRVCPVQYAEQGFASPAVTTGTQGAYNFVYTPTSTVMTFTTACPVLAQIDVRGYIGVKASNAAGNQLQIAHAVVQFRVNGGAWAQSDDSYIEHTGPYSVLNDAGPNVTGSLFLPAGTHTFEARGGVANIVNQDGLAHIGFDSGRITVTLIPSNV